MTFIKLKRQNRNLCKTHQVKDGNARQLKKTANALAPIEPEKEKPRTPDDSDSISDEAKEEHTTDATRFHEEMWETNLNLKWFYKKKY